MPKATCLGDIGSGHACHFPPTASIAASPNVDVNGIPAVRQGDAISCGGASDAGSGTVFIRD